MKLEIDGLATTATLNRQGERLFEAFSQFGGVMRKYGQEMYFLVNFDFAYEADTSTFEVGDIIYWKSDKSWKEAVAFFWGPTPIGDGTAPRAPGPALKIGTFDPARLDIDALASGSIGRLILTDGPA